MSETTARVHLYKTTKCHENYLETTYIRDRIDNGRCVILRPPAQENKSLIRMTYVMDESIIRNSQYVTLSYYVQSLPNLRRTVTNRSCTYSDSVCLDVVPYTSSICPLILLVLEDALVLSIFLCIFATWLSPWRSCPDDMHVFESGRHSFDDQYLHAFLVDSRVNTRYITSLYFLRWLNFFTDSQRVFVTCIIVDWVIMSKSELDFFIFFVLDVVCRYTW